MAQRPFFVSFAIDAIDVSMYNILIVQALKEEAVEIPQIPEIQFIQLFTGCGKSLSAISLMRSISAHRPDAVINIGTVGAANLQIGEIVVSQQFIDRDMILLREFGTTWKVDANREGEIINRLMHNVKRVICSTGDRFVTDKIDDAEICDMEGFPLALICSQESIPFVAVKYVTDIVGQNSVRAWEERLADARAALSRFLFQRFNEK